ncbi:MAG: chloride channel protein [Bacteroidetes bacterium]|nr:chloride channel protein [Bacteroidota bacterium]
MKKDEQQPPRDGIPVSVSLDSMLQADRTAAVRDDDKWRLLRTCLLAVLAAVVISGLAKLLVLIIDLFTAIAFQGRFTFAHTSPADHALGAWVVVVPAIGGVLVGLMAYYGSKAIRGHGIPEAMEQVLTNQSRIKPSITYLKPLSSAISIGTGGPFGAEGPIIATGGAFGSTLGQLFRITPNERKVLLAAGATAGMSAIFGSPIAAIFLAIELLLFEFSPRSLLPVVLACITGAAGHRLLFEHGPVFPMPPLEGTSDPALFGYSLIGLLVGVCALGITKLVYAIEDGFERLPIHWMWWPAIGGLAVGVVGYFAPHTLGVGYENITGLLSGITPMRMVLSLAFLKLISWMIALGSGTSGGTLAPLLTIGAAFGLLLGMAAQALFPAVGLVLPMAALVGMSALFAGASRALLTSIVFALETTQRPEALLPLLGACAASYLVSYVFMKNTIMTEKIARRGVRAPHSYGPDVLESVRVEQVMDEEVPVHRSSEGIGGVLAGLPPGVEHLFVVDEEGRFEGIADVADLRGRAPGDALAVAVRVPPAAGADDDLRSAAGTFARTGARALAVLAEEGTVVGLLTYREVLKAYGTSLQQHEEADAPIVLKRRRLKMLVQSRRLFERMTGA